MKSQVQTSFLNRAGCWTQLLALVPGFGPSFLGFLSLKGRLSPRLVPEPPHSFEVDRPAPADQQGMDPPVSVTRMPPRQSFDLPGQGRLVSPAAPAVSQDRARPPHDAADPPLRDPVLLAQVIGGGPLLVGAHHFFLRCPGASVCPGATRPPAS